MSSSALRLEDELLMAFWKCWKQTRVADGGVEGAWDVGIQALIDAPLQRCRICYYNCLDFIS